jgi:hypothetical protein
LKKQNQENKSNQPFLIKGRNKKINSKTEKPEETRRKKEN